MAGFLDDVRQLGEQFDEAKQELLAPVSELTDDLTTVVQDAAEQLQHEGSDE